VVHRADQAGAPPSVDGFDALVVMGGPRSAHSDDGFPTRRAELALIADALGRELPVLGVCLGAQLLAEASGGRARRGEAGLEVGWAEVALTPAATDDELFASAPATFTPLHWHGDTVVLPPGAVLLASSDRYPNQAFRVGHRAWGIQFHLEADRSLVEAFTAEWPTEARHLEGGAAGIVAEADVRLAALAPVTASILGRFASTASGECGR
jgi:GMP synthase-like glutamine amidotransferase